MRTKKCAAWLVLAGLVILTVLVGGCKSRAGTSSSASRGGHPCGGMVNFKCPPTQYCRLKENCGGFDSEGTCADRPLECPAKTEEVCGCDGKTYLSECHAAGKGISVKVPGPCEGGERG